MLGTGLRKVLPPLEIAHTQWARTRKWVEIVWELYTPHTGRGGLCVVFFPSTFFMGYQTINIWTALLARIKTGLTWFAICSELVFIHVHISVCFFFRVDVKAFHNTGSLLAFFSPIDCISNAEWATAPKFVGVLTFGVVRAQRLEQPFEVRAQRVVYFIKCMQLDYLVRSCTPRLSKILNCDKTCANLNNNK